MREILTQQAGGAWILICAVALAALVFLLLTRQRRRRNASGVALAAVTSAKGNAVSTKQFSPHGGDAFAGLDSTAIKSALRKAEKAGQREKVPRLHLALAHACLAAEEKGEAEEYLRAAILGAGTVGQKDIHAKARLALGDLAHAGGDLTTACEHWQIARALYLELKLGADHEAVENRMRCNGCPTDWVLTDF